MTGKMDAMNHKVDWAMVERLTEIPRTYQIELIGGGVIFKMYKPSELQEMKRKGLTNKWKRIQIVSTKR